MNTYQRMKEENEQALKTMANIENILNNNSICSSLSTSMIKEEVEKFWAAYGRLNCQRSNNGEAK